jgi:hypothetical protein
MHLGTISAHWSATEWSAFGTVLVGLGAAAGAIAGGFWTLFSYRKERRAEAVRWRRDVFRDFYLDDRFREIKQVTEYEYAEKLEALLARRVTDPDILVQPDEMLLLEQLDTFLNYFEFVLHLESKGHLELRDQQALFEYWLNLMADPERVTIRGYVEYFGFGQVASALGARELAA